MTCKKCKIVRNLELARKCPICFEGEAVNNSVSTEFKPETNYKIECVACDKPITGNLIQGNYCSGCCGNADKLVKLRRKTTRGKEKEEYRELLKEFVKGLKYYTDVNFKDISDISG